MDSGGGDDLYSDGDEDDLYESEDSNEDEGYDLTADSDDGCDATFRHQRESYTILSESDIRQRQEEDAIQVSTTLSITGVSSSILLSNYNWDVGRALDEWFANESKVRKAVGLLEEPVVETQIAGGDLICEICFDTVPPNASSAAACGHRYCNECWRAYVGSSINDGLGCLILRCPHPSCKAAVDQDMVDKLASDEDKEKYRRCLLRSYIEGRKMMKWCPSPNCEFAVDLSTGDGETRDVCCNCSHKFCLDCTEEAHGPVDCQTAKNWIAKNSSEGENKNWFLVHSKACPKCKRPIEKNQGCMHMMCSQPCGFEFCWLCLGSWKDHATVENAFDTCNRYSKELQEGLFDELEREKARAKESLNKYIHYYHRWASNDRSMKMAVKDLRGLEKGEIDELREKQRETEGQMKFITEAWLQIVECRRVLKWTYVYGYYLPEQQGIKKRFFEHLQGKAEAGLELLHHCAEKELRALLDAEDPAPMEEFNVFRAKLTGLTSVTRTYFGNLVGALETGLTDVSRGVLKRNITVGAKKKKKNTARF